MTILFTGIFALKATYVFKWVKSIFKEKCTNRCSKKIEREIKYSFISFCFTCHVVSLTNKKFLRLNSNLITRFKQNGRNNPLEKITCNLVMLSWNDEGSPHNCFVFLVSCQTREKTEENNKNKIQKVQTYYPGFVLLSRMIFLRHRISRATFLSIRPYFCRCLSLFFMLHIIPWPTLTADVLSYDYMRLSVNAMSCQSGIFQKTTLYFYFLWFERIYFRFKHFMYLWPGVKEKLNSKKV